MLTETDEPKETGQAGEPSEPPAATPPPRKARTASKRKVIPADRLVGCEGAATVKGCRSIVGKAGDGKWAIVTVLEVIENKTETLVTSKRVKG